MTTQAAVSTMRYVGLDVHAETITAAVADADGAVHEVGTIANEPAALRKVMRKLGPAEALRVCYEAGPTGYVVYWQLVALGVACEVIAPSLIPTKAGDRVKTDRRDAVKLARCYRAGELTPVFVPDAARGTARCGAGAGGRETGSAPGAASVRQVAVAAWTPAASGDAGLDAAARAVAGGAALRGGDGAAGVR